MKPEPSFSHSIWPRRYLIFGPLFGIVQIVLFYALFIIGLGMSDSGPLTPGKVRIMDVISVLILAMGYPLDFLRSGRAGAGAALALMSGNALIWGLCAVGVWHAMVAVRNRFVGA